MAKLIVLSSNLVGALLAAALVFCLAFPALGDEASPNPALDVLFASLRAAPDAVAAQTIERQIWTVWLTPTDPDLASRMLAVAVAEQSGDLPGARTLLDKLVVDFPTYAEGFNQRATVEFEMHDFEASLADIDKVLQYEPRHFGALSGRVMIYLTQGKRPLALRDMMAALAIDPFLSEKLLFPELMRQTTQI